MGIFSSGDMDTAIETIDDKERDADRALIRYLSLFREYVIGADRKLAVSADAYVIGIVNNPEKPSDY